MPLSRVVSTVIGAPFAAVFVYNIYTGAADNITNHTNPGLITSGAAGTAAGYCSGMANDIQAGHSHSAPHIILGGIVRWAGVPAGLAAGSGALIGSGISWIARTIGQAIETTNAQEISKPSSNLASLSASRNLRVSYDAKPATINYAAMNVTSRIANLEQPVLSPTRSATYAPLNSEQKRTYG